MTPEHLHQLEQQLRSPALNERKVALDTLATMSSDVAVPILERLTTEADFLQRRFAVMGLGNHRTEASLAVLMQLLDTEKDSNVIAEITNSLFEFGDPTIALLPQLFDRFDHWLIRQTILSILIDADRPEMLMSVIRVGLADETVTIRETAILALGQLVNGPCQEEAISHLLEIATSTQWRDRWRAATALVRAQDPRAKQTLATLQQDANHYVVAAALEAKVMD